MDGINAYFWFLLKQDIVRKDTNALNAYYMGHNNKSHCLEF